MQKKRILAGALAAVLIAVQVSSVYANNLTYKVDGLIKAWKAEPITVEGNTLVSVSEVGQMLDASVSRDEKTKSVTIQKEENVLQMKAGTKEATLNKKVKTLPVAPVNKDNDLMVPLRFVCETMGATVSYDSSGKVVTIMTGESVLRVMAVNQGSSKAKLYTYDEAVKKTININSNLKTLHETIDTLMESRSNTVDQYYDTAGSLNAQTGGMYDMAAINVNVMRALDTIERSAGNIYQQETILKVSLELLLRSTLNNIAASEMNEQVLQARIDLQTQNVNNLTLKQSLGMASDNDVITAKQTLEQYKTDLSLLQINLANEKRALNKLLGESHDQETIVQFKPVVKPQTINVERHISLKTDEDPNIKIKKSNVEQAKLALNTTILEMYESKVKLENDLTAASRALLDYQNDLEAAIRKSYNSILQLEEKEKTLKIDLEKAKNTYNTVAVNYQAGNVTMYEVDAAKLGILSAEVALSQNAYTYWLLMYQFENPFLLVSQ